MSINWIINQPVSLMLLAMVATTGLAAGVAIFMDVTAIRIVLIAAPWGLVVASK